MRESDLVGKTEQEAIEYANQYNYKLFVAQRDGCRQVMLLPVGEKIIRVEIEDGKISKVLEIYS